MVSADAVKRDFNRRLSLNRAVSRSPYWALPVDNVGHSNYQPVGRGVRTSPFAVGMLVFRFVRMLRSMKVFLLVVLTVRARLLSVIGICGVINPHVLCVLSEDGLFVVLVVLMVV